MLNFGLGLVEIFTMLMAKKPIARILYHNPDGISNDRISLQEHMHSLYIHIALIYETKLPAGFVWKTYNIRSPNPAYGGTAVLVRSYIQQAVVNIPVLKSF